MTATTQLPIPVPFSSTEPSLRVSRVNVKTVVLYVLVVQDGKTLEVVHGVQAPVLIKLITTLSEVPKAV